MPPMPPLLAVRSWLLAKAKLHPSYTHTQSHLKLSQRSEKKRLIHRVSSKLVQNLDLTIRNRECRITVSQYHRDNQITTPCNNPLWKASTYRIFYFFFICLSQKSIALVTLDAWSAQCKCIVGSNSLYTWLSEMRLLRLILILLIVVIRGAARLKQWRWSSNWRWPTRLTVYHRAKNVLLLMIA